MLQKHNADINSMSVFGNSRSHLKSKKGQSTIQVVPRYRSESTKHYPGLTIDPIRRDNVPVLSEDIVEREKVAKAETERKKKYVGLAYNKGNYVYLGENPDPEIIKSLGRK